MVCSEAGAQRFSDNTGNAGMFDISMAWPVGSIYISVSSGNPAESMGFGTWELFAAGRTLIGINTSDSDYDAVNKTGGTKTKSISAHAGMAVADHGSHTHTYSEVLNHTHGITVTDPGHTHTQDAHSHTQPVFNITGTTTNATSLTMSTTTTSGQSTDSTTATNQSNTTGITASSSNPGGGVVTGTTAGTILSHSVTQPNAHDDISIVQPFVVVYIWKRVL